MPNKKERMKLTGFSWDAKKRSLKTKCELLDTPQPYSDATYKKHFGMPIDLKAASGMVQLYYDTYGSGAGGTPFEDIAAVSFSKASIFRVLSQEGCDFIRFYFCIPDKKENKASLILEGLNSEGKPIGKGIKVIKRDSKNKSATGEDDGQYEEKGNGEGEGIVFLKTMIEKFKKSTDKDLTFENFMTFFYNKLAKEHKK